MVFIPGTGLYTQIKIISFNLRIFKKQNWNWFLKIDQICPFNTRNEWGPLGRMKNCRLIGRRRHLVTRWADQRVGVSAGGPRLPRLNSWASRWPSFYVRNDALPAADRNRCDVSTQRPKSAILARSVTRILCKLASELSTWSCRTQQTFDRSLNGLSIGV